MKRQALYWAKRILELVIVFFTALFVMILFLVCSSGISRYAIQANMEESSNFIRKHAQIEYALPGVLGTQIHYTADVIWLSIAYGFDFEHPFESTMQSNFYTEDAKDVCESFVVQVQNHRLGNTQYLRYWHGTAAVLRFLHVLLNVRQIYIFHSLLMAALLLGLLILLYFNELKEEAIAVVISLLMVSAWVVPLCLEYTGVFLIMLVVSIIGVCAVQKKRYEHICALFLITGMVTVYLDFLTTETLTLLIPLLLIIRVRSRQHVDNKSLWEMSYKAALSWLLGYCSMWSTKWVISSVVLHQNVMPLVQGHISKRLGGSVGLSLPEFLIEAIVRNIQRLAFYDYGIYGAMVVFIMVVVTLIPIYRGKVKLRETINKSRISLYIILMLIPYIRFLILHNHSYGHYCFTYRAQAASILALCFIVFELIEPIHKTSN